MCACAHTCARAYVHKKESEDNLVELILLVCICHGVHVEVKGQLEDKSFSFYYVGPED